MIGEKDQKGKVKISLTEDRPIPEKVKGSLQSFVADLPIPKKVELATRGNAEVRKILSRDPNSIVARAVVNSPRISERDVLEYTGSSLTNEDVLRLIGESREWSMNRRVKLLLVSNPRTPTSLALRLLGHLSVPELKNLASNKSISAAVCREAKRRLIAARK